ncbi:hypothetical protein [Mariprofundus ferrooxydans]|uniref:Transposase n=1 Tax=Mariprofundus ferrooxydans PV-1 TaxID=314345 RepID=Q0F320_9PROT|nr:hypothetical protein [Mariprofundus ferrooxydans]EAU56121.1 hypothetical protein SPV1_04853 [Mariprofundus ferrooxydans PV-1]KON48100.1 hypothetical protein AL013_04985 [Mariprofundus ferrooxydans]
MRRWLGATEEILTVHGGLALFGEFCAAMKLGQEVNRHLPAPGSAKGFRPGVYVQALALILHGGDVRWRIYGCWQMMTD